MRDRVVSVILTWPFIICVLLLLLNDRWWKYDYPGILTGKLSDFAGLGIVGMLLLAAWPGRRYQIYVGLTAFFFWWKSPLSATFISAVNGVSRFAIDRTIDYTDLAALTVLPFCWAIWRHTAAFAISRRALRKLMLPPLMAATVVSILGTSIAPTRQEYAIRATDGATSLRRIAIVAVVDEVATRHGMRCQDCTDRLSAGKYEGNEMWLAFSFRSDSSVSFTITAMPDGLILGASGKEKADALRTSLRTALGQRFRGLEYVESLDNFTSPPRR